MFKKTNSVDLHKLKNEVFTILRFINRFKVVLFIVVVATIYGLVLLEINNLNNYQPPINPNPQSNPMVLSRVDLSAVKQLQNLKNNNVKVQALFNQSRTNPFQE